MESLAHDFVGRKTVQELGSLSNVLQRYDFEAQGLFPV